MHLLPVRPVLEVLRPAQPRAAVVRPAVVVLLRHAPDVDQQPRIGEDGIVLVDRGAEALLLVGDTRVERNRHRNLAGGDKPGRDGRLLGVRVGLPRRTARVERRVVAHPHLLKPEGRVAALLPVAALRLAHAERVDAGTLERRRERVPRRLSRADALAPLQRIRRGKSVGGVDALVEERLAAGRVDPHRHVHPPVRGRVVFHPHPVVPRPADLHGEGTRLVHHLRPVLARQLPDEPLRTLRVLCLRGRDNVNALRIRRAQRKRKHRHQHTCSSHLSSLLISFSGQNSFLAPCETPAEATRRSRRTALTRCSRGRRGRAPSRPRTPPAARP